MDRTELETKFEDLYRLLIALNAYGSLHLKDLKLIEQFIKANFDIDLNEFDETMI